MSARVKFLFDTDFASADPSRTGATAANLAEAEARGYRDGLAAGKAEALADIQRQLAQSFAKSAAALQALAAGLLAVESRMQTEAVEVAVAVARKLTAALLAREPLAEVEALAVDCFRHLVHAPHVVMRVNDALYDEARARLTEIAERSNFGGRFIVLPDPELAASDCRIEWADGGMVRSLGGIEATVAAAVERYLAAGNGDGKGQEFRSTAP